MPVGSVGLKSVFERYPTPPRMARTTVHLHNRGHEYMPRRNKLPQTPIGLLGGVLVRMPGVVFAIRSSRSESSPVALEFLLMDGVMVMGRGSWAGVGMVNLFF